ncbi:MULTISPECIES: hypothetical protein [unclassified Streptomyces]|uniref:hypothetical protein n=1 Tax=unclassified Streptomyces TaxID=2593676 RepID=UPI00278C4EF3|nr:MULTISPECIES: hypothetical protein [unclassified Streptomyces]
MRRIRNDENVWAKGWAEGHVDPKDWAQAVRTHEAAHVTLSEAYGIPVHGAYVDPHLRGDFSRYSNDPADVRHQAVVHLIGGPAGSEELRQLGYDDDGLLYNMNAIGGHTDRGEVWKLLEEGLPVDGAAAQAKAHETLQSPGFMDATHSVAEAFKDQGDRLTRQDIVAAMGSYRENNGLLTPQERATILPPSARREREEAERQARDDRYFSQTTTPEPGLERDL